MKRYAPIIVYFVAVAALVWLVSEPPKKPRKVNMTVVSEQKSTPAVSQKRQSIDRIEIDYGEKCTFSEIAKIFKKP